MNWTKSLSLAVFGSAGMRTTATFMSKAAELASVCYRALLDKKLRLTVKRSKSELRPAWQGFGGTGRPTAFRIHLNPKFNQPNRRGTDPYARWCGRTGAARHPPIPIGKYLVRGGYAALR